MIRMSSVLNVADNSGVKIAKCIHVNGSTGNYVANIGDAVVMSAKNVMVNSKIKKGDKIFGIIIRTKSRIKREDGSYVSFGDNAVILINKNNYEMIGSRVFGPVAREIRNKYQKIASLAKEVL